MYRGFKAEDPGSEIYIEPAEEVKTIAIISNPEVNFYQRELDIIMIQHS